jgi:hypothetical protein
VAIMTKTAVRIVWIVAGMLICLSVGTAQAQTQRVNASRGEKCAEEGAVCNFQGGGTVYYGVGNTWIARPNSSGGIRCTNEVFGDPAPNRVKSCFVERNPTVTASQGVRCAEENQTCTFFGRGTVYYGAGNTWIVQEHTNGVNCSNTVFGDPAKDRVKACFVVLDSGLPRGVKCANENQRCQFNGPASVHYGAGAAWITQGHTGGVDCSNAVFGDPAKDRPKMCYVETAVAQPLGVRCAVEGGTCTFQGVATVYYGSGRVWVQQRHTGSVACTNMVFGDPTPNVAKSCFVQATGGPRGRGRGLARGQQ